MKNDSSFDETMFEVLDTFSMYLEEHLNAFWRENYCFRVVAEPMKEVEERVMNMISDDEKCVL